MTSSNNARTFILYYIIRPVRTDDEAYIDIKVIMLIIKVE